LSLSHPRAIDMECLSVFRWFFGVFMVGDLLFIHGSTLREKIDINLNLEIKN